MRRRLTIFASGVPVRLFVSLLCAELGATPDVTLLALYELRRRAS